MKKRVMFLIESMIVGGAERVLINLVNNLDPEKYDITVISVFRNSVYKGYDCTFADVLNPYVNYRYLIDNRVVWKYRLFNILFNRVSKRFLHRLLIGKGYDIEVAWYEGLPTTFLSHSSNNHSRKLAWLHYGEGFACLSISQKELCIQEYRKYDKIVGVSHGVCHNFQKRLGKNFPLITCYNIIDEEEILFKADAFMVEREASLTFVSVGRLIPVKGYDRLINACARLKREGFDFRLWLIGDGEEYGSLKQLIIQNGLNGDVYLLGNQSNPYPYMKTADWFISSSFAEGFSTVLTEAYIIGTPIISTRCLGTAELLGETGEYGLIIENSEDAIYQAMQKTLTDPYLRDKFSGQTNRRLLFTKRNLLNDVQRILQ